jgi:hypothetical protein
MLCLRFTQSAAGSDRSAALPFVIPTEGRDLRSGTPVNDFEESTHVLGDRNEKLIFLHQTTTDRIYNGVLVARRLPRLSPVRAPALRTSSAPRQTPPPRMENPPHGIGHYL